MCFTCGSDSHSERDHDEWAYGKTRSQHIKDGELARLTSENAELQRQLAGAREAPGEPTKLAETIKTFVIKWRRWKAYDRNILHAAELHPLQEAADALCALYPEAQ